MKTCILSALLLIVMNTNGYAMGLTDKTETPTATDATVKIVEDIYTIPMVKKDTPTIFELQDIEPAAGDDNPAAGSKIQNNRLAQ